MLYLSHIKSWTLLLITVFVFGQSYAQKPDWSVEANNFQNNMTVTGVLELESANSTDTNDIVAAFVGNECRGIAKPIFNENKGAYFVYFLIMSNQNSSEELTFKMYDSSLDKVVDCVNKMEFNLDEIVGSISNPYIFTNQAFNAEIVSFGIKGVSQTTILDSLTRKVNVEIQGNADLGNLIAEFSLSPGATTKIDTVTQESGVTANDFSSPIVYSIFSADGKTSKDWVISIEKSAPLSNNQFEADNLILLVFPNPFERELNVTLESNEDVIGTIAIYDVQGREISVILDQTFKAGTKYYGFLNGDNLSSGVYNVVSSTNKGVISKKVILVK
ncbi:MAG: hypothetical protein ACJATA_000518 [Sphingobacteriales bacterium]|jgi:hypothetical protein